MRAAKRPSLIIAGVIHMKFEMPIIFISTIAIVIYFVWSYKFKKRNSIYFKINTFKYIILPMLLYFLIMVISPFIIVPAFPESYEKVNRIFQIIVHLICFLYLITVDLLMIKGKAGWFLEKQTKSESNL